ncbi:MAG: fumarylacetoacetate hydrolase family protein [Pseudomonadota bacterium]
MNLVFPPAPAVTIPIRSGRLFPVRQIYCVGRNYAAHAREMGGNPEREPPFFFMKPAWSVASSGAVLTYPPVTTDLQPEVELVVALGAGGRSIPEAEASACIFGYAVGLDMTRRDLQQAAKTHGRPWDLGKSFEGAAPIGALTPVATCGPLASGPINLQVNGALRQSGDLGQMIWTVPQIIAALSHLVALHPGDLIFTGTPAGVAPVVPGDRLEASIAGLEPLMVRIA